MDFIYSVFLCFVETSMESILILWSFYTLFTLCPFETKRGSILCFGPGMYFETSQVFFVPEWPKGEFVSILYWQHSG
jgi:hypothetical protein